MPNINPDVYCDCNDHTNCHDQFTYCVTGDWCQTSDYEDQCKIICGANGVRLAQCFATDVCGLAPHFSSTYQMICNCFEK